MRCKMCGAGEVYYGVRFDHCCDMKIYFCRTCHTQGGGSAYKHFLVKFTKLHSVVCDKSVPGVNLPNG